MNMLKVSLIQMLVTSSKSDNVLKALSKIKSAAERGSKLICLPECFNCPYGVQHFSKYSEEIPNGETCKQLCEAAKSNSVWLVGGSIPESINGKLFNTSVVYNPDGQLVCKYSKIHLFDIDVPGKITFKESDVLVGGSKLQSFTIPLADGKEIRIGLGICYDVRFPELAHIYARDHDCSFLLYPGAFNMTTGPAHWELLARARAIDNQCYIGLCSVARDVAADYVGYGHSLAVGPWGNVISSLGEKEDTMEFIVDFDEIDRVRSAIPIRVQRREDVYSVTKEK